MSVEKEFFDNLEQDLEYGRDKTLEALDSIAYEQFWSNKNEAAQYVNKRLSETDWQSTYNTKEDAIYHFAIKEQQETPYSPETTVSPKTPSSPF